MFRYVIKGKMHEWLRLEDLTISMMQYFKDVFNKKFGNDWYIEFKDGE